HLMAGALNTRGSLTMSYFHTGTRTIIGAESFHCPVRDGKEWDQLAMVIRLKLSPSCFGFVATSSVNSQSRLRSISRYGSISFIDCASQRITSLLLGSIDITF